MRHFSSFNHSGEGKARISGHLEEHTTPTSTSFSIFVIFPLCLQPPDVTQENSSSHYETLVFGTGKHTMHCWALQCPVVATFTINNLKQHCVTLTANCGFEKRNLMMHVHTSHKTAILVKPGHILWRKCPLVFPLMSYDCSASTL